jgi:hypothetical protein
VEPAPGRRGSGYALRRIVILNKIDGLWDDLRTDTDVDAEIGRQVVSSAHMLGIPPAAGVRRHGAEGAACKVNGDDALLTKSRLPVLEDALSRKLIPAKRDIVGAATRTEVKALAVVAFARCSTRGRTASPNSRWSYARCAARITTSSST